MLREQHGRQNAATVHDTFYFIGEINEASIVMLAETGIVPRPLAARIARGIRTAIDYAREALLATWEALNESRGKLLALAARHVETIVPAYTLDVQAQPTSLGHYLSGMAQALRSTSASSARIC